VTLSMDVNAKKDSKVIIVRQEELVVHMLKVNLVVETENATLSMVASA